MTTQSTQLFNLHDTEHNIRSTVQNKNNKKALIKGGMISQSYQSHATNALKHDKKN